MKRVFDPALLEMMDRPQPVTAELASNLENLRRLNHHFGSYRLIKFFLKRWMQPGRCYRLLDLATGSGDVPRKIVDWARARKITVRVDAVDLHPSTLEIAKRLSTGYPEISLIRGDARTYSDTTTYDIVFCSLALHHFSEEDAVKVLRRANDLSHDHVVAADLERTWLTWLSVRLITTTLFRDPMTKFDARLSVERAFSFCEMGDLASQAGWEDFQQRRFLPARQAIWQCKMEAAPIVQLPDSPLNFAT